MIGVVAGVGITVGGCGNDAENQAALSSAQAGGGATTPAPLSADAERFLSMANGVCSTVREMAPAKLAADAGPAEIERYVSSAARSSSALATSLRRLPAPAERRATVDALAKAYRSAARDYRAMTGQPVRADEVPSIRETLRQTSLALTATAQAANLPACAEGPGR